MSAIEIFGTEQFYSRLNIVIGQSKREAALVIDTQFGAVIRNLLSVTPPMGGSGPSLKVYQSGKKMGQKTGAVDFGRGKKAGERTIGRDVSVAFKPLTKEDLRKPWGRARRDESGEETLAWYLSARNKRKRVRAIYRPTSLKNIMFVKKYLLSRQGSLAAGWSKAANYFGITLPAWISRWGSARSKLTVQLSENGYNIEARNSTSAAEVKKIVERTKIALSMQSQNMQRMIDDAIKKSAQGKGFKVR